MFYMPLFEIGGKRPKIDENVSFIAESAEIIGDVEIGEGATIFPGVVIEGFPIKVQIGKFTNIQSNSVVHGLNGITTIIGDYNTIGHRCIIHGCELGENVTVGIGSIVMGKTKIGDNSMIGAGSLVTQGKDFASNSLILGSPAKRMRDLKPEEMQYNRQIAKMYSKEGRHVNKNLKRI